MNSHAIEFSALDRGLVFPELRLTVSGAGNERYWRSAGVDHPALRSGSLYPPIAANLTVLLVQQVSPGALLHTRQTVLAEGTAPAGQELVVTGRVAERFDKRGRDYVVVDARVTAGGAPLWRGEATFTAAGAKPRPSEPRAPEPERERASERSPRRDPVTRALSLGADELRAYSRSGNFHSDADEARRLGMHGLVAQGMQVCGPAYGVVLDAWGERFLTRGRFDARFVGMVVDGQTVEAAVEHDDARARFTVHEGERVVALGAAIRDDATVTPSSDRAR